MSKVNNLKEFLLARGLGEKDFSQVEKNTFKHQCAIITYTDVAVRFFSHKECDHRTGVRVLFYPFLIGTFWDELDGIQKQASDPDCQTCDPATPARYPNKK